MYSNRLIRFACFAASRNQLKSAENSGVWSILLVVMTRHSWNAQPYHQQNYPAWPNPTWIEQDAADCVYRVLKACMGRPLTLNEDTELQNFALDFGHKMSQESSHYSSSY